jgi:adenylate cyclase
LSSRDTNMPASADAGFNLQRHRKVVLIVDLVESVSLMQADELGVIQRWQAFLAHVNQVILPANQGRLVKSLGDGLLMEFDAVPLAAAAASAMHAWMASNIAPLGSGKSLSLRAGLHATDIYADGIDIYGNGVNLASRVATLAQPHQTAMTVAAREELVDGLDADIEDLGECYLKHIDKPIRIYRIGANDERPTASTATKTQADQTVVAVLPFDNRRGDPQHTMVGDLISDAVIHQLARTELHVLSRLSCAAFKGRTLDSAAIARHLGARYALTGAFHVRGARLFVSSELSDLQTGTVLWADRRSASLEDLFDEQSELVGAIANGAYDTLLQSRIRHARNQPPETLDDYSLLVGGIALMHRQSHDDFARARQLLEHLTERRPRFGMPRAWLGQWYVIGVSSGWLNDPQHEAKRAMFEIERASDRDPSLSLAMTIKGQIAGYLLKDFDAAERSYQMAIAENPNEALAWLFMATLNAWKGLGQQAREAADRALLLSPLHPARYYYESLAATAYLSAGEYATSAMLAERSLRSHRLHASTYKTLVVASAMCGNEARAREVATALLTIEPLFTIERFVARSPMANSPQLQEIVQSMRIAGLPAH